MCFIVQLFNVNMPKPPPSESGKDPEIYSSLFLSETQQIYCYFLQSESTSEADHAAFSLLPAVMSCFCLYPFITWQLLHHDRQTLWNGVLPRKDRILTSLASESASVLTSSSHISQKDQCYLDFHTLDSYRKCICLCREPRAVNPQQLKGPTLP